MLRTFQCRTRLCGWCNYRVVAHFAIKVRFQCRTRLCGWCNKIVREAEAYLNSFNAARGFVGGATGLPSKHPRALLMSFNAARGFVGGATLARDDEEGEDRQFQCRTRLCGWCNEDEEEFELVPMTFQCRTRLCGWCNSIARSPCPPRGKKPFWKVSGNLSVLTENM